MHTFDKFPSSGNWPRMVYSALLAHQFLPEELHRILFLDIDVVVNGNINEFYNLPFDDNYFIASREFYNAKNEPENEFEKFTYESKADEAQLRNGKIFNSGVLLFNLDKLREDNINIDFYNSKLKDVKNIFADQGVYNYCFYNKVKYLTTCKYNYRTSFSICEYLNADIRHKRGLDSYTYYPINAKIIHYCGYIGIKPWKLKLAKGDVPKASNSYLGYVPQSVEINNIWWNYAALLPEDIYLRLEKSAELNTAAYRTLFMCVNSQPYSFHNALRIESLSAPTWDRRNNINLRSDLNDYLVPFVYICDAKTKTTIRNLPTDFGEEVSFRLTVKQLAGKPLLQELEADNDNATVWRRTSPDNGTTWSEWNRLATIADIQSIVSNTIDFGKYIKTIDELNQIIEQKQSELTDLKNQYKSLKEEHENITAEFKDIALKYKALTEEKNN